MTGSYGQLRIATHTNDQLALSPGVAKRDAFELQITQVAVNGLLRQYADAHAVVDHAANGIKATHLNTHT